MNNIPEREASLVKTEVDPNLRRRDAPPERIGWGIFALVCIAALATVALFVLNWNTPVPSVDPGEPELRDSLFLVLRALLFTVFMAPLSALFGALIVSRYAQNRIGWLLSAAGLLLAANVLLREWVIFAFLTRGEIACLSLVVAWIHQWLWLFGSTLVLSIIALFPDGRFQSRRWRWLLGGSIGLLTLSFLLASALEEPMSNSFQIGNPMPFVLAPDAAARLFSFGVILIPVTVIMVLAQLVSRYRTGTSIEKQQIKWLLVSVALMTLLAAVQSLLLLATDNAVGNLIQILILIVPLLGVGLSILKYRLYDIDLIIRKTLQYGVLTAILALVYAGLVVFLPTLVGRATGEQSPVVIVVSTLAIAALFLPLRRRVQAVIDRRFFRQKYDAQQILARFAATARDEVDMDQLNAALLQVVEETMQPESATMWLHQGKR